MPIAHELCASQLWTAGGFGDTVPIRPGSGEHQVLFTYTMPYSRKLELSQNLPLATNAVVIFVPDQSINIKGAKLEDGGKQDVEGITYRIYNRAELDAGELFRLEISGKPVLQLASRSDSTNTGIIIGLVALGLALIIGGIWVYSRNKVQSEVFSAEEEVISPASTADEHADSLIDAIMALDDLFKDGQLPEVAYRQRRAELKQRLAKATG